MNGLSTVEFLSYLRSLNVKVFTNRGRLRFTAPPEVITPDLRNELVARKSEIVSFLKDASLASLPEPPAIERISRDAELPLSFAQSRLWVLDQLEPDGTAYNIPSFFRFKGDLNQDVLEQSLTEVERRHEVLRTYYPCINGRPVQKIAPSQPVRIPLIDLQPLPQTARYAEALRLASELATKPFDLGKAPLIRPTLLKLAPDEHVLLLDIHHIAFDGWSASILIKEFSSLYQAFLFKQASPLSELPIQYADFAKWQRDWLRGEVLQAQIDYWKRQLAGNLPVLELPTDRSRPAIQTFNGANVRFAYPKGLTDALEELSRNEGVTVFVTLLTAFNVLLSRYTGQEDILVGTPIANRNRPEIEGLIGFFVNTLVMRTDLSGNPSFRTLLRRVHETALEANAHQDLPFEKLVEELRPERDLSRTPIVQVMFSLLNRPIPPFKLPGLDPTWMEFQDGAARFDLSLNLDETEQGLAGSWSYNTDLFDEMTITRMGAHFRTLLEGIVSNPDCRLHELPLLSDQEIKQEIFGFNETAVDYPPDAYIQELFEAQVERTPRAVAVEFEGRQLTYDELNVRANQLARYLRRNGVVPDTRVGVCMERSPELVIALYAVLKAGGAYVPIDPDYPQERVAFMLQDAAVEILLTQSHLVTRLPRHAGRFICLDVDWGQMEGEKGCNPRPQLSPDNLAYVIYTSGSTGKPKGAMNTHRGISNRLLWMQDQYQLTDADTVLQKTPFSFDVSVWEFFWPLLVGARLLLAAPGGHRDAAYLVGLIAGHRITIAHFVPSMLRMFLQEPGVEECRSLRHVICSGEALPFDLQEQFFARLPAQLHNLYGPTEAAVDVTHWTCQPHDSRRIVPIGRPVANTQVYVLDQYLQPVPRGVVGELYIGGVQVGRGYHNRPKLTEERFVQARLNEHLEPRLYRTGDLCRRLSDGSVEYLGRSDFQFKIRGFRIELGEIEETLREHPLVKTCVVAAQEFSGDKRLVAYVVWRPERPPAVEELRKYLGAKLPDYMVPWSFVSLDELPAMPNGKVDRKALPVPSVDGSAERPTLVVPETEVEKKLANLWKDVLALDRIGIFDNFFDLGGHSLLAVALASKVERAFGKRLPLASFIQAPTIHQFSELLHPTTQNPSWSSLVMLNSGSKRPLFLMHSHGGNVLEYQSLANWLGREQRPVYALQAQGLDGNIPEEQHLEKMVSYYLEEIRSVQPEGPYCLGGYCLGGMLALEAAHQLRSQNEDVDLVVMINTTTRHYPIYLYGTTKVRRALDSMALRFALEFDNLSHRPRGTMWRYVLARAKRVKNLYQHRTNLLWDYLSAPRRHNAQKRSMIYDLERLAAAIERAGAAYRPKPYDGRIFLLHAKRQPLGILPDPMLGWDGLLTGYVKTQEAPGFRQNMLYEPNVAVLANLIADALQEVEIQAEQSELRYPQTSDAMADEENIMGSSECYVKTSIDDSVA
jgi:amino acid adenylation domain-containing protein